MSCTCSSGVGDTGLTSCLPMNEITSGLLFQQTYTSAGARNNLAGSSIGTAAYLTGLTQNADETVRIMPLQNLVEVVDERGETTFYTDDTGVNHELKEGERVFNGEIIINASPQLYGELNKFKCIQMSVYNVGDKGGIFGDSDTVSELEGFEIAGSDKVFYPAVATIKRGKYVIVKSDEVKNPVAVRYAWRDWVKGTLFDTNLLPASSFRTDSWDDATRFKRVNAGHGSPEQDHKDIDE